MTRSTSLTITNESVSSFSGSKQDDKGNVRHLTAAVLWTNNRVIYYCLIRKSSVLREPCQIKKGQDFHRTWPHFSEYLDLTAGQNRTKIRPKLTPDEATRKIQTSLGARWWLFITEMWPTGGQQSQQCHSTTPVTCWRSARKTGWGQMWGVLQILKEATTTTTTTNLGMNFNFKRDCDGSNKRTSSKWRLLLSRTLRSTTQSCGETNSFCTRMNHSIR